MKTIGLETCTDLFYLVLNFYQINRDGEIRTLDWLLGHQGSDTMSKSHPNPIA
jgi:hypothetical protein